MSWFVDATEIGQVRIEETFVDYDGPRLFTCRSNTDQLYLVNWVDEGERDDTWLYVAISQRRLDMVRSGMVPLRDAFVHAEGAVFVAVLDRDSQAADRITRTEGEALPSAWLPDSDERLSITTATLPPAVTSSELERRARQEGRTRFRVEIDDPSRMRSEGSTRRVGELLVSLQNVFDNVGLAQLVADPPQAGRIPAEVTARTATDVLELAAASFVIELGSEESEDLFGDSPISRVVATITSLLNPATTPEQLIDGLTQLRPRGAKSFRNFVGQLASNGADIVVTAASSALGHQDVAISAERLVNLKELLSSIVADETREIRGRMRLYRYDMQRKLFGVEDLWDHERYEGKIADRALAQVDHAVSNGVYEVLLTATTTFDQAMGDRKPSFVLEQLVAADSEVAAQATVTVLSGPSLFEASETD